MRAAALVLVGLAAGFIGAMLQTFVVWVGDVPLPVGAVATLVVVVLLARCGRLVGALALGSDRLLGGLAGRPAGDGLDDPRRRPGAQQRTRQLGYLVVGAMLLAGACGFPLLPAERGRPG